MSKENGFVSVILTVHNQQDIVGQTIESLIKNASDAVNEIIIIFDGCTDMSYEVVCSVITDYVNKFHFKIIYAANVFETKANNIGLKAVTNPYAIINQDDCWVLEKYYDQKLLKPILQFNDVFAVSGRNAHDIMNRPDGTLFHPNCAGSNTEFHEQNIFYIRQVVNRGPLLLKMDIVKQLHYLDEDFAPLTYDDHSLCIEAAKKFDLRCGCVNINFRSDMHWGSTRKLDGMFFETVIRKNEKLFWGKHGEFLKNYNPVEERMLH